MPNTSAGTAPAAAPDAARRRSAVGLLSLSHLVDDMYQGAVPALLPFFVLHQGYGYAAATGIVFAATVLSSVAQPLFGMAADRWRVHWPAPAGLLLAGLGVGLSGLGDSYWWTWTAIALSGLGVAAYHPVAASAVRAVAGPSAQGMSWFAVGGNIGLALGPVAVTPVVLSFGLAGTPLLAVPALVMAGVLAALGRSATGRRGRAAGGRGGGAGPADDWSAFARLTGVVVLRSVMMFGTTSLLGLSLIDRFGFGEAQAGWALTGFLAVGAAATVTGGWIADRWARTRAVRIGYAIALPSAVLLAAAPAAWAALLAAAGLAAGIFLPFAVQTTLGQSYLPTRVGTASGVTLGLAVSAGGVVAPLLGWIAEARGLPWAQGAVALSAVAALALSFALPERGRGH